MSRYIAVAFVILATPLVGGVATASAEPTVVLSPYCTFVTQDGGVPFGYELTVSGFSGGLVSYGVSENGVEPSGFGAARLETGETRVITRTASPVPLISTFVARVFTDEDNDGTRDPGGMEAFSAPLTDPCNSSTGRAENLLATARAFGMSVAGKFERTLTALRAGRTAAACSQLQSALRELAGGDSTKAPQDVVDRLIRQIRDLRTFVGC